MSVLPGLMDMHVHLMILGHADYEHWDKTYMPRFRDEIMPIAARQLLMSGVTTVRDLGAPLEDILRRQAAHREGRDPGTAPLRLRARSSRSGPTSSTRRPSAGASTAAEDARAKVQKLIDAGVDFIKLIDQDQLTDDEVAAVVETAHRGGKPVVAHAHREDEIRIGLKHGVDCFEHTGLATEPGYPEDILAGLRKRNNTLYWCPTIEGLFLADYTARVFPERLDDPAWQQDMPQDDRGRHPPVAAQRDVARLLHADLPPPAHAGRTSSSSSARRGVTLLVGTDSGIPGNFHTDSTWRELETWVRLGMTPMQAIAGATRWPARFLKKEKELGTLAPGRLRRRDRRARRRAHPHRPAAAGGRGGQERRAGEVADGRRSACA